MDLHLENQQTKQKLNLNQIKKITATILRHKNLDVGQLNIIFVSRQKMQALNKKYKYHSYATDVLAFDLRDDLSDPLMGDIVISVDAVISNAREFKTQPQQELILYVIHGLLHFLGYQDHNSKTREVMRQEEKILLDKVRPLLSKMIF